MRGCLPSSSALRFGFSHLLSISLARVVIRASPAGLVEIVVFDFRLRFEMKI